MKIGIDIGGSHISAGIVEKDGNLIGKESRDLYIKDDMDEKRVENIIVDTIKSEISILLDRYDYKKYEISKIGVAVPGNPKDTYICNLVNLKIKKFDIGNVLKELFDTDITIRNDGKCSGLAEKKYGSLQKFDDAIFLCIGTGVGSSVFESGKLLIPKTNVRV